MGIHYDYKSKRGERAMLKEAKRKERQALRRAKRASTNLNKEEEEILKEIEMGLTKDDPKLEKAVENLTLSNFSRARISISFITFILGFFTMIGTYTIQAAFAVIGFLLQTQGLY